MAVLDLKDWKILFELDLDSRQSLHSIGKKVGLSKEVVNYRLKKLCDEGIITSFFTRIDTSKLGILMFRTFIRLYNLNPEKEKELIEFIVKTEKVGWCVSVVGNWDLNFIYWADSIGDFSSFWRDLLSKYGEFIQGKNVSVFDRYIQFPKLFLLKEKKLDRVPSFPCGRSKKMEVDRTDTQILSILASNSRMPSADIAKKTGISPKAVSLRIKRLKELEIIQGFGISLDLQKIGFDYFKLHLYFKRFDKKRFEELLAFCHYNPYIVYTNEPIGGADLELDINIEDEAAYNALLNEIRYKFSDLIKDFESLHYFEEIKMNLFPKSNIREKYEPA